MRHGNEIAVNEIAVNKIAVNEIAVNEIEAGRRRAVPWNGRLCGFGLLFFCFYCIICDLNTATNLRLQIRNLRLTKGNLVIILL